MRWPTELVVLGEDSRSQLADRACTLSAWCESHPNARLKDVSFSLRAETGGGPSQLAIVATSTEDLARKLGHAATRLRDAACKRINERSGIYYFDEPLGRGNRTAFLFPGEGSQYPNMLADLCLHFPEVRACFDLLERAIHQESADPSPRDYIFPHSSAPTKSMEGEGQLWQMAGAVEAVLTANRAILTLLERLKIVPDAVLGHSTGEYAALLASGALRMENEEELVRHLCDGNRLSQRLLSEGKITKGSLLAVSTADPRIVAPVLEAHPDSAWVAIDNCPRQIVVFATESSTADVMNDLQQAGALCQILPFDRAYHTPLFAPVRIELERLFEGFNIRRPAIDIYSCATAQLYPAEPDQIRNLALEQWTSPVRFQESIENMYAAGVRIFVEVGPRGNLSAFVDDILRGRPHLAVPSDLSQSSGLTQLHHALGRLAANAVSMNLDYLYTRRKVKLISFSDREVGERPSSARKLSLALPVMQLPAAWVPKTPTIDAAAVAEAFAHRGNGGPVSGSRFMSEYLETMEQFLDTQQVFLTAFAGGRSRRVSSGLAEFSHSQSPLAGLHGDQCEKGAAASSVLAAPEPESRVASSIEEVLLDIVSHKTGYPREILSLSANLEADLGIDSIKRIEILGAFQQITPLFLPEHMDRASQMKTLQQIVDVVQGRRNGAREAATPSPASSERLPEGKPRLGERSLTGKVVAFTPGKDVRTARVFDVEHDRFLKDHALGGGDSTPAGLVVLPLTIIVECLAQVATFLAPGKQLLSIREIRVNRWLTLEKHSLQVEMSARAGAPVPLEITASMTPASASSPAAEATFVFGEPFALPPAAPFRLSSERPSRWGPEELYAHGMFHGPAFRGVRSIERVGAEGIEATLCVAAEHGLFSTPGDPGFLTSPLLLDAVGQLIGFWAADRLPQGYVVFPFHVRSVEFYGDPPRQGETLVGRARISQVGDARLLADLEVLDSENLLRMRIRGWEDKRIDMPGEFFQFRIDPVHKMMSRECTAILTGLPAGHGIRLYRLDMDEAFLRSDGGIWRSVLAHMILGPRELDSWRALTSERRSNHWLIGRAVAKDAVRAFLRDESHPASVEILSSERGAPYVSGEQLGTTRPKPAVSISHIDHLAVAAVADGVKYKGVGIDVESMHRNPPDTEQLLFSDAERRLAAQQGAGESPEWTLRMWCAREAVAKALGCGLTQGISGLAMCGLDASAGTISFKTRGRPITAYTMRDGELIVAVAGRTYDD